MVKRTSIVMMLIAAVLLSACNFPLFRSSVEQDSDALATAVAETVQALNEGSGSNDQEPDTPPVGLPTITPLPTYTPSVVQVPPTATPLPCNKAQFVSETIPDDTEFASGEVFTKSWTLKNIGTCTWNTNYKLTFVSGDAMSGPASVNLVSAVAPNAQVTISVDLTAPTDPGIYTGHWEMQADDAEFFGKVYLRVKTETVFFQVTGVTYYMPHTTIDMECPGDVAIKGEITTSAAGTVTYYWTDSDSEQSATKSIIFDAAEAKIVDYTMNVTASGDHWAKLYINQPNHQLFGPKNFTVNCTTP